MAEMQLLNDLEFWVDVFVAVKGHFLYIFGGRQDSDRLLDVICLKGARVIDVDGGHFYKSTVMLVKENIHWNNLRPAMNRRGAWTDLCCYCRNPSEFSEERSEWMLHIPDALDHSNWVYFSQARSASQRTRVANVEGGAALMEAVPVKEPPPPLPKATVFATMKYYFEWYAEGGEGCTIEQEGFKLFLDQMAILYTFIPSYTSSEELMREADIHSKGKMTFDQFYSCVKQWRKNEEAELEQEIARGQKVPGNAVLSQLYKVLSPEASVKRNEVLLTYYHCLRVHDKTDFSKVDKRLIQKWNLGNTFATSRALHRAFDAMATEVNSERGFSFVNSGFLLLKEVYDSLAPFAGSNISCNSLHKAFEIMAEHWECTNLFKRLREKIPRSGTLAVSWPAFLLAFQQSWELWVVFGVTDADDSGILTVEELALTIPVFIQYYGELPVFKQYQVILSKSLQRGTEVNLDWAEYLMAFGTATFNEDLENECVDAILDEMPGAHDGYENGVSQETILIDVDRAKYGGVNLT